MAQRTESARQRPGIRDVAARAGVSVSTVSRILNGSYPPAPRTRDKVMRAVRELDYVANPHARALTGQDSGTIAIVVRELDAGFLLAVVQAITAAVTDADRLCLIGTTGREAGREIDVLRQMNAQHVQAIILTGTVVESDQYRADMTAFAQSLAQTGTRLVLCARPPIGPAVPAAVAEYDNEGGAYAATSHLLSRGHRRILQLSGPDGSTMTIRRLAGYRKALADLGGVADPDLEVGPTWDRGSAMTVMNRLLGAGKPEFTAVMAHTDQVAAGALQALREHGLSVPGDISVIGYDDSPLATDLGLTSVHIPAPELGRAAARLALEPDGGEQRVMFGTHVVVRTSVAVAHHR